jgi:hypothetical protein
MKKLLAMLAVAAALCVSADSSLAQGNGGGGGGRGGGGGGGGFGQMDPAQRQQMMMDRYKQDLGFTNDTDWSAVEPLVQKVADAQREAMQSRFAGAFGRRGGRNGGGGGGGGGGGFQAPTDPDREALQQAVDSGAPAAQVKAALDKYRASQKAKQAKLESAQADLKKVLSQKQEAAAVLAGLLN